MITYRLGVYEQNGETSAHEPVYIHRHDLEMDQLTRRDIYFDRDGSLTHCFLDDGNLTVMSRE